MVVSSVTASSMSHFVKHATEFPDSSLQTASRTPQFGRPPHVANRSASDHPGNGRHTNTGFVSESVAWWQLTGRGLPSGLPSHGNASIWSFVCVTQEQAGA